MSDDKFLLGDYLEKKHKAKVEDNYISVENLGKHMKKEKFKDNLSSFFGKSKVKLSNTSSSVKQNVKKAYDEGKKVYSKKEVQGIGSMFGSILHNAAYGGWEEDRPKKRR